MYRGAELVLRAGTEQDAQNDGYGYQDATDFKEGED